ncbi:hypothetical protein RQP46_007677 [Phenoliferia psychrophenolica]
MGVYDGSIGAFLVGTLLNVLLLGVTALQAWNYYTTFPKDRKLYWWLVSFLLLMDWVHSAVSCFTVYDWTVTHYGDLAHLAVSPWSFAIDPAMTGIVASVVQMFYAYRVYVVGKRALALPIAISFFSMIQLGFACGATGQIFHLKEFAKFQSWTYGVTTWLVCAAVADLLITGSLVYHLNRSKQNVLQATSVCEKLIELVIQTNGLTAACAVIDAVLFATLSTSYHVTVNLCLIKLYFNSLLVSLNARASLERHLLGPRGASHWSNGTPTLQTASGFGASDITGFNKAVPHNVLVTTTESVQSDVMSKDEYEKWGSPSTKSKKSATREDSDHTLSAGDVSEDATLKV